jgi:hypothetical protein
MFNTLRSRVALGATAIACTALPVLAQGSGESFTGPADLIDRDSILTNAGAAVAGVVVTCMGITLAFFLAKMIFGRLRGSA